MNKVKHIKISKH